MKQQPSSPNFADILLSQRKIKHAFFSQIDKIIDWTPIRGIIEVAYTKGHNPQVVPVTTALCCSRQSFFSTWYGP